MKTNYTEHKCKLMIDNMSEHVGVALLHPDGHYDILGTEARPSLYYWQNLVGGFVEVVRANVMLSTHMELASRGYAPRVLLLVNEEGLLMGLPYNELASAAYLGHIVGPAVICAERVTEDGEPDIAPMPMDILVDVLDQIL